MASKTIFITGCSKGGIGDALAREFRARGHAVFASARSMTKMTELAELGIKTVEMDVTSPQSIAAAVAAVRATGTGLDILVNNAGVNHVMPFADTTPDDFRRVMDTNVFGVYAVTHAFLPLLVEAKGVIANIGSINQVFNPPYHTAYNASKAALAALGNTLRVELAPFGVRVVTIITGSVRSHLFDNTEPKAKLPEGSWYAPLKDRIEKRDFLDGVKWTPADEYAKQVASDLLKDNPKPVIWRAALSMVANMINNFGWVGMMVRWTVSSYLCFTLRE